jgi:DNA-binding MarR family transcriptional regulator
LEVDLLINERSEGFKLLGDALALEVLLLAAESGEITSEQREGLQLSPQQMAHAARQLAELSLAEVMILPGKEGSYRIKLTEKGHRVTEFIAAIEDELK